MLKPKARTNQLIVEELAGECVVYDTDAKKAHSLNSTAAWIWRHCDGSTEVDQIALQFERDFGCEDASVLVTSGLRELGAANLLISAPLNETSASGGSSSGRPTRRSVIGAGATLAPVIASILVPTAASAQSRRDNSDQGNDGNNQWNNGNRGNDNNGNQGHNGQR